MDIELLIMVTVITSKGLGKFCNQKKCIYISGVTWGQASIGPKP